MAAQPNSSAMRTAAIYILHCWQGLGLGQFGLLVLAPIELHAFLQIPIQHAARFGVADLLHGGVERGLAEALLEHAGGCSNSSGMMALNMPMQPSSKTPMMAFALLELPAQAAAQLLVGRRQFDGGKSRTWLWSWASRRRRAIGAGPF